MTDWTGSGGTQTSLRYRLMAERELRGNSPSYERICLAVAADDEVIARLDELPPAKRQPNLLLAAVRYLGGPLSPYPDFRDWVLAAWPQLSATMLERRTQTNEAGRCATLLPVLSALEQPLALLEVGASAGLCLYPDRYGYRYATSRGQRRVGRSTVEFPCAVNAPTPLPTRRPDVVWRAGLDLAPLDVLDEDDVRWLEALVWPEQTDRLARLRAAVEIARHEPMVVVAGDARTELLALAERAPRAATLVVFHSAVLAYLDPVGRREFEASVRDLATSRRVCWVSNEAPGVISGTDIATGGRSRFVLARDGSPIALAGPHGQSLDWLAA